VNASLAERPQIGESRDRPQANPSRDERASAFLADVRLDIPMNMPGHFGEYGRTESDHTMDISWRLNNRSRGPPASLDEAEMFGILSVRVSAPHYALFEES
jgi:hypothetical protein